MNDLISIYKFLSKNDSREHPHVIKNVVTEYGVNCWRDGYFKCLADDKKRRGLKSNRLGLKLKSFLDYLNDTTYG
jgi:hypothetical protein